MCKQSNKGFSLIELMIATAVIAILSAFAWPSYQNYIIRSSRQAAQQELLQLANLQEKIYLNANTYTASVTNAYNGRADGGLGRTTGRTSDNKYTITVATGVGAQSFVITASPRAGTTQENDGWITISSDATRILGPAPGRPVAESW